MNNNTYLFLVYSLCAITIIYLIHTVILTELNKYNKDSDKHTNKTGDDNYDDNMDVYDDSYPDMAEAKKAKGKLNQINENMFPMLKRILR